MGKLTNFKVNDDGSVTVANLPNKDEANILDILRIEKAKGGAFASRRMKKRALKYAKQANIPEYIVEKLMLDNYPNEFACYPKTTKLIAWRSFSILFVLGAILFAFPTYFKYEHYLSANEDYEAYRACRDSIYEPHVCREINEYFANMSIETYNDTLNERKQRRDNILSYSFSFMYADLACLLIAGIGVWQCRKVRKSIMETATKQLDNG